MNIMYRKTPLIVLLVLGVSLLCIQRTDLNFLKLIKESGFGGQSMVACRENAHTSLADTERPSGERLVNAILTEYNSHIKATFENLVAREVTSRDPELISLIRQMLDPPSNHMIKMSRTLADTPQSKVILDVLDNKMNFQESTGGTGKLTSNTDEGHSVPCFPLESMLLALNTTHVDYFSLDVEGYELEVLRTIPFDRIDISALSVEFIHGKGGKEEYKLFMEKHGFVTFKEINHSEPNIKLYVNDFIFVNKNIPKSSYAESAQA